MALAFTTLMLIVHSYVAWAAGRLAAPLPGLLRAAIGCGVAATPLALLVMLDASHFDGTCADALETRSPCGLGWFVAQQTMLLLPYFALPMLIWLGFYASSLARARAEAEAR